MKIHCVWSRNLDVPYSAGRLRIARRIRDALERHGRPTHHVMNTVLEGRRLPDMAQAAWNGIRRRLPMQCWLFDTAQNRRLAESIPGDADAVYLDGIRTVGILQRLRQRLPQARLVVDLDDLMSRRTEELLKLGEGFSAGYLADKMPRWGQSLGGPGLRYEREALLRWEQRVCGLADEIVLLSPVEAAMLKARAGNGARARIRAVPPPEDIVRGPVEVEPPLRFVFIGSDTLTQNRLTIAYLLDLWQRVRPATTLHVYGRMTRSWQPPANVEFHGYVGGIDEVYDKHSVLLTPSVLRGGVKTKVLEAFAWGAPVLGNAITFEGLPLGDYPGIAPLEELVATADSPATLARLNAAARLGNEYVRLRHDTEAFAASWVDIVAGREAATAYAAD